MTDTQLVIERIKKGNTHARAISQRLIDYNKSWLINYRLKIKAALSNEQLLSNTPTCTCREESTGLRRGSIEYE